MSSILSTQHGPLVPVRFHGLAASCPARRSTRSCEINYEIKITISYSSATISSPHDAKQLRAATSIALELYYIYTEKPISQQFLQP